MQKPKSTTKPLTGHNGSPPREVGEVVDIVQHVLDPAGRGDIRPDLQVSDRVDDQVSIGWVWDGRRFRDRADGVHGLKKIMTLKTIAVAGIYVYTRKDTIISI